MIYRLKLLTFSLLMTILIVGCGGGGTSSSDKESKSYNKGYYIDSAIVGVDYDCETVSGITNTKGEFKFESGHSCQFKIDGIVLRKVPASQLKDGVYILEDNTTIAAILQTSDKDGNASNGIDLSKELAKCLNGTLSDINLTNFHNCLANDSNYSGKVVTEAEAAVHINETIKKNRPTANSTTVTTLEDTAKEFTLNATDSQGDSLSATITTQPQHGTVSVDGINVTYTPNSNYNGSDSFKYKVSDGTFESNESTVSISITAVNDAPTANGQTVTTSEDNAKNITLTGSDIDGDAIVGYTITQDPQHGSIGGTLPNITYTPDANFNGSDSFKFKVNDGSLDSSEATVTITVTPVNDVPTVSNLSASTIQNQSKNITLMGSDIDSSNLTYIITSNPSHGSVTINGNIAKYTPNNDYSGSDSFKYKAYDGSLYSSEGTVSIDVLPLGDIVINNSYQVVPLGAGVNINKRVYLNSSAKNLYLVLSNIDSNNTSGATISHSPNIIGSSRENRVIQSYSNRKFAQREPLHILEFNSNSHKMLKPRESNQNFKLTAQPKQNEVVGDSYRFYLSIDKSVSTVATLRKVVSNVNTAYGSKSLYVWVSDDSYGSGCAKDYCIDQTKVDELADMFLKSGSNNDIYDWVTNIYGEEWGSAASNKYSNLIGETNRIDILLTDINNDNNSDGGVAGYFWSKDNFYSSDYPGSNERVMFYADSVMFANTQNNGFWQKEVYVTLAHEFQHMINYYQKSVIKDSHPKPWLNEMMSVATEDLVTTKIGHIGDRGVDPTDGSAGNSNNSKGRFSTFNANNTISVTSWNNTLEDYAKVSSFGAFLLRNYGGAELLHNMINNSLDSTDSVIKAIYDTTGKSVSFEELLQQWGVAIILSDLVNIDSSIPQYNFGDFKISSYGGINYEMGSINFFNYTTQPAIYTTVDKINPQANYYYKVGENISNSYVDISLTLDENTSATLVAK